MIHVTFLSIHGGCVQVSNTSMPCITVALCILLTSGVGSVIAWTCCDQSCDHYPRGPQHRKSCMRFEFWDLWRFTDLNFNLTAHLHLPQGNDIYKSVQYIKSLSLIIRTSSSIT